MTIEINNKPVELPQGATLEDAITTAGINPQGIATAVNGVVVPAPDRKSTVLNDNDKIVVISAFCGG